MREKEIDFIEKNTLFLCILPFLEEGNLRGYIIMEGDDILVHDDSNLLFISDTISYMLGARLSARKPDPAAYHTPPDAALKNTVSIPAAARLIDGLNVDKGISLVGGSEEQYGELLRLSAKVFIEGIQRLSALYQKDIPAFAVEVHGMKGALYTIGADSLGDKAKDLELAAKGGDATYCTEGYPGFEEKLGGFARKLAAITERPRSAPKSAGSGAMLAAALRDALEAVEQFNSTLAGKIVSPLLEYSWAEDGIGGSLEKISNALENIDYDESGRLIAGLLESIGEGGAGI
jgi:hypothetical protein